MKRRRVVLVFAFCLILAAWFGRGLFEGERRNEFCRLVYILDRWTLMVISRIKEKLEKCPPVTYTATEGFLEIPAQSPAGFRVWIQERSGGCTVGFEGWHEEFTDADEALNCFAFGLSTACRLRVFRCRGADYKWQVLIHMDGQWVADTETGLLFPTFWLPKKQRDLQNDIIIAA